VLKAKAVALHNMEVLGGGGDDSYSFMTLALDGVSGQCHALSALYPQGKERHWTGGWMRPRAGLDTKAREKILSPLPGLEPQLPVHPVHSQTLY
jgi:hypothetical protein